MPANFYENSPSASEAKKMLNKHAKLVHTENIKVLSHVQRESGDWIINTLMLDNIDVPFKYKRKKNYQSLKGQRVNITYYPDNEVVAGFNIEIMSIVRIKVS
ncbi:hypothetical protein GCM10009111_17230 [Colwellia asteriadis]|uniref:Uncharacterized protein n=1 Tax=Colwellia asteriadis TaxID=517723 RepID=A0ABN1L6N7_9GAMM|nr:hypothetical protein [Colwellia sp. D2M02]